MLSIYGFIVVHSFGYYTRVFNQNDWMKKRVFILFLNRICRRLEGVGAPNLSANLSVSPGVPDRKSHCRWIRVFRYICSYLQTGKYKFTTSYGGGCFFREKKRRKLQHAGALVQFYQDKQIQRFYCRSVISFCKTVFFYIYKLYITRKRKTRQSSEKLMSPVYLIQQKMSKHNGLVIFISLIFFLVGKFSGS